MLLRWHAGGTLGERAELDVRLPGEMAIEMDEVILARLLDRRPPPPLSEDAVLEIRSLKSEDPDRGSVPPEDLIESTSPDVDKSGDIENVTIKIIGWV